MTTQAVLAEVGREREAQDREWGGPAHDDLHNESRWVALLTRHAGLAVDDGTGEGVNSRFRRQMVRVAALAVAAVESLDRREARRRVAGEHTPGPGY